MTTVVYDRRTGQAVFVELSCDDVLLLQMRRKIMTLSNGIELQTIRTMNLVR